MTGAGTSQISDDAGAVVLNVTATGATLPGHVRVYPCGEPRPDASNVNYTPGADIANAVIAKVGTGGNVCLYTSQATHLVVDVTGWFLRRCQTQAP